MKKPVITASLVNSNNSFIEVSADDSGIKAVVKMLKKKIQKKQLICRK
jgi:hypothetical protein